MMKLRGLYFVGEVFFAALAFANSLALLSAGAALAAAILAAATGHFVSAWILLAYALTTLLLQMATRMRYVLNLGILRRRKQRLEIYDRKRGEWIDALATQVVTVREYESTEGSPYGPFSYTLPAFDISLGDGRCNTHLSPNGQFHRIALDVLRTTGVRFSRGGLGQFHSSAVPPAHSGSWKQAPSLRTADAASDTKHSYLNDGLQDKPDWKHLGKVAALVAFLLVAVHYLLEIPDSVPVMDIPTDRKAKRGFDGIVLFLLAGFLVVFWPRKEKPRTNTLLVLRLVVGIPLVCWYAWLVLRWKGLTG
jgi:hypothetical protein